MSDGDGEVLHGITLGPDEQPPDAAETITDDQAAADPVVPPFNRVRIPNPRRWRRVGSWSELLECPVDGSLLSGQRGAFLHMRHFHSDDRSGEMIEWAEDLWDEIETLHRQVADHVRRKPQNDRRRMWGPEWFRNRGHSSQD